MKRTHLTSALATEDERSDQQMKIMELRSIMKHSTDVPSPTPICSPDFDDDEADFLRDVWEPTGDAATELEITTAFRRAGYVIRKIELVECHRVWVIKLRRETAPKIRVQEEFHRQVRNILGTVKICFRKKSDLTAQPAGDRALVGFIWPACLSTDSGTGPHTTRQPQ
jgi:hypothetical protein